MKIFKIVAVSILALTVILFAALAVFVNVFAVKSFKPQIVAAADKALSRHLDFTRAGLGISWSQGICLKVSGISISEDPGFAKGDFLEIKSVSVGVDVLGYLFHRKISVTGITIDSPKATIIRKKDGSINAQTIAKPSEPVPVAAAAAPVIPAVLISSVNVVNAAVVYVDESFDPAFKLEVKDVDLTVKNISLEQAANGQFNISAGLSLTDGSVQLKELAVPVSKISAEVKIRGNDISLDKVSMSIGAGSISASGALKDYPAKQDYNADVLIKGLKLQELISPDRSPVKMEGAVAGSVKIKGGGFTPEALKTSLSGSADITATEAKLKDLNVLKTVLEKITILPGLLQTLESGLPSKYQQKLAQKDTAFADIKIPVVIGNGTITLNETTISSDDLFIFKCSGRAGFDASFEMEGSFFIPAELSGDMVSLAGQLQYLLDDQKQIYIPLKVSGNAGQMKFTVDPEYIAKKLVANQAKQQILKIFERAAGSQSSGTDSRSSDSAGTSSAGDAVNSLLGNIFK